MAQESTSIASGLKRERRVQYAGLERRVIHAPADPQPQQPPPKEGQPQVPHDDEPDVEQTRSRGR